MRYLLSLFTLISILFFPFPILAKETDQFITLVNPVRISHYSSDPERSMTNQYNQIKFNNLAASWLLTFDALENDRIIAVLKTMDNSQDIGIFMEVTENSAQKVNIKYNKTDSWHRSTSIFLSGYTQSDRIKFIDAVFEKFKEKLDKYPTSVGAWWIDSFSLEYMQKKYGITATLGVSDQFDTDGYTIWGQYWAAPYYPSKIHSAIPASSTTNKIDVVNLQWAPRDPLNGYITPSEDRASLYSTQDYFLLPQTHSYFEKLIELYAGKNKNSFGQITFGLEGDFPPESYTDGGQYANYIKIAKKYADSGNYQVINMKDFSQWYRKKFPDVSPSYTVYSKDLLGTSKQALWYQSQSYRIGFVYNPDQKTLQIVDLRTYARNFQEPFYLTTNKQLDLYINLPSVINGANYPTEMWEIKNLELLDTKTQEKLTTLTFSDNKKIELKEDRIVFSNLGRVPQIVLNSPFLNIKSGFNSIQLSPNTKYPYPEEGYLFSGLTLEDTYLLQQRRVVGAVIFSLVILTIIFYFLSKVNWLRRKDPLLTIIFMLLILTPLLFWYSKNNSTYYVSQSEVDALLKLKSYPGGNVLVLNKDCLQCSWQTKFRPAALANKRNYIAKITNKRLIYDDRFIEKFSRGSFVGTQIQREQAKEYLQKLNVKYIYLVKHEDYLEKLPHSPGDFSAEQIFINSDTEIWRINL